MKTEVSFLISLSLAFLAVAKAEDVKVFSEAFRVEGIGDKAMALCLEGDKLYAGAGSRLYVYDVSKPLAPRKLGEVDGLGRVRQIAVGLDRNVAKCQQLAWGRDR